MLWAFDSLIYLLHRAKTTNKTAARVRYYESISFMPKPSDPKLQDADSDDDVDMSWFQMQMDKVRPSPMNPTLVL